MKTYRLKYKKDKTESNSITEIMKKLNDVLK